jgi:hypothetical protein
MGPGLEHDVEPPILHPYLAPLLLDVTICCSMVEGKEEE